MINIEDYVLYNAFRCPFNKETKKCIFNNIRIIDDLKKRIEYIENMTEKEKQEVYVEHEKCLYNRENALNITES